MPQDLSFECGIPLLGPEDLDYEKLTADAVSRGLTHDGEEDEPVSDFFGVGNEPTVASLIDAVLGKDVGNKHTPSVLRADAPTNQTRGERETGRMTVSTPKSLKTGKASAPAKSKWHAKDNKRRKFKAKESSKKRSHAFRHRSTRKEVEEKYVQSSRPLTTPIDAKNLPTAQGAYWGRRTDNDIGEIFSNSPFSSTLEAPVEDTSPLQHIASMEVRRKLSGLMENQGFKYQAWKADVSHPVLDSSKRIVTVLVGKPKDGKYDEAIKRLFACLVEKGAIETFTDAEQKHRRGQFPALNIGFAVGPGSSTASRIHVGTHEKLAEELLANEDLQRLASHQDASFHAWAPKLHDHYSKMNKALFHGLPEKSVKLSTNFERSVFSSMAINFPVGGKSVCTVPHRDLLNLPYGWCAVHALGDFDPKAGGHIILWELKLIIEFPPGACILLPSATVTHFNVPIRPGEVRASITQYTGGNLFRFVDNGMYTDSDLRTKKPKVFRQVIQDREQRWINGLSLLRKYDQERKCFV